MSLGDDMVEAISVSKAGRDVLKFTYQYTGMIEPPTNEFDRGVRFAAEEIAMWVHEHFGIPPMPGKCPCYHCWKLSLPAPKPDPLCECGVPLIRHSGCGNFREDKAEGRTK